ncbi:TPA: hypothetical protein N0F65_006260 [Lagenidium giganteum]|uniref:Uncharacterized protein n=1 Tax=Lagenidium giganteum TaxID=4803 RepID=A0AAV2Z4K8_9STRA|nr:TPA: hypothetical protein N0F65_006260 [Lagenidium giganteum]
MQNKFLALIEAGPTCEKFQNKAKVFMSMAFCYGCDPDEPTHFTPPLNTQFFSAEKTVKICTEVSDNMAPAAFADCGFMLPDDRETICSPNSAVVPEYIWPDCLDGQYMCFINSTKTWNCSDGPCQPSDIPTGFTNVPCNITERTCEGVLMLLNDNRAAKPPNYEDYPVELIDRKLCMNTYQDDITCACLRIPSDFSSAQMLQARTWTSLPLILALSAWLERNG